MQWIKAKHKGAWDSHSKYRIVSEETSPVPAVPMVPAAPMVLEPGSWHGRRTNYRRRLARCSLTSLAAQGMQGTGILAAA